MRPASSRVLLAGSKMSALLISNLVNIRYLTGCNVDNGLLLALPRGYVLFVDSRYAEAAEQEARAGVRVRLLQRMEMLLGSVPVCGMEAEDVTIDKLRRWQRKFKNTKFVRTEGVVEDFRRTKDRDELRLLRRAEKMTLEMLRRVPSALRSSITERALAWKLRLWAEELGADGLSFNPIVAFGTNTSRPHHHPTTRALKKGHIVQIDVGARYQGYCADLSRVFFTVSPTPLQKKVLTMLERAQAAATAKACAGVKTADLDRAARNVLAADDFEEAFTHSLGHGVGLEVHEGARLSSTSDDVLRRDEVITVEPGVYFPGKFGMRVEDMVVVE